MLPAVAHKRVNVQILGHGMAQVPAASTTEGEVRSLWRPAFLAHVAALMLTEPIGVGLLLRVVLRIVVVCTSSAAGCTLSAARSRLRIVSCMCARNVPRFMRLFRHRARLRRVVRRVRCMERAFGCIFTRRPSACNVACCTPTRSRAPRSTARFRPPSRPGVLRVPSAYLECPKE